LLRIIKGKIIKRFLFLIFTLFISESFGQAILQKQLSALKFILKYEGEFIYTAKHDGIRAKDGSVIYTIGFGTRSFEGEKITYDEGVQRFYDHSYSKVFKFIDPKLPEHKYIALSSAIYRTGVIIKDCKTIKKYIKVTVKDKKTGKIKKIISKGLARRADIEYKLCIGDTYEIYINTQI
jgi:hypothetical protein